MVETVSLGILQRAFAVGTDSVHRPPVSAVAHHRAHLALGGAVAPCGYAGVFAGPRRWHGAVAQVRLCADACALQLRRMVDRLDLRIPQGSGDLRADPRRLAGVPDLSTVAGEPVGEAGGASGNISDRAGWAR